MSANTSVGLRLDEVLQRQKKYGLNEIDDKQEGWLHRLFRRVWGSTLWMIDIIYISVKV